jgi:hypothetical protein
MTGFRFPSGAGIVLLHTTAPTPSSYRTDSGGVKRTELDAGNSPRFVASVPLHGFMDFGHGEFCFLNRPSMLALRTVHADIHIYGKEPMKKNRSELDRKVKWAGRYGDLGTGCR